MNDERREQLKSLLMGQKDLPPLPVALATIMNLMADEDVSIKELEKAILQEPAITTKILSLSNSAFYGYRRRISTISQAVVVLGLTTVRNLVLGVYVVDGFRMPRGQHAALDGEQFWLHCVCTATVSGIIARRVSGVDQETSWIAGLLHDMGKMVLSVGMPDVYRDLVARCRAENRSLRALEEEQLGANHAHVGEWMSQRWQLPENITTAIRYHHEPQTASGEPKLVATVHLADILVKQEQLGESGEPLVPKIIPAALDALGFGIAEVKDLLAETRARSDAMREFHSILI